MSSRDRSLSVRETQTTQIERRRLIYGIVQGVGFRPFVYNLAGQLELSGWVHNSGSGVEMELQQAGFRVLLHRQVPANDGGLAAGQPAVASARLKETSCA